MMSNECLVKGGTMRRSRRKLRKLRLLTYDLGYRHGHADGYREGYGDGVEHVSEFKRAKREHLIQEDTKSIC